MKTYILRNTEDFQLLINALHKELKLDSLLISYNVITALGYGDYDYLWDHLSRDEIRFDGGSFSQRFIEELTPRLPSDFELASKLESVIEHSLQAFSS